MNTPRRAVLAVAVLLAAVLSVALAQSSDSVTTAEATTNVVLSRTRFAFVSSVCRPAAADTQATYYCRLFWTVLWPQTNAASATMVRMSLFPPSTVELVNGIMLPKAGAVPLDSWTLAYSPDWNNGKGLPADKVLQAAQPQATFPKLETPLQLFARLEIATSDAEVPVVFWTATVAKHAYVGPTLGGVIRRTLSSVNRTAVYLDVVCGPAFGYSGAAAACNRVDVSVRPGAPAPGVPLRVTLYTPSAVVASGAGFVLQSGAEGMSKSSSPGADGSWRALFGQAMPGDGTLGEDTTVPGPLYAFAEAAANLTSDVALEARIAIVASFPTVGLFEAQELAFSRRSNPTGRSFSTISAGGVEAIPFWLWAAVIFGAAVGLTAIVAISIYCCKTHKGRHRMQEQVHGHGHGGHQRGLYPQESRDYSNSGYPGSYPQAQEYQYPPPPPREGYQGHAYPRGAAHYPPASQYPPVPANSYPYTYDA